MRALAMSAIGAGIGWLWGPLMLAHLQPWAAGLIVGGGAASLWGMVTLIVAFLKAPGKLLQEKDAELAAALARIRELETPTFTSEGLDYSTRSSITAEAFVVTADISPVGDALPIPLTLIVQCSEEPKQAVATFTANRYIGDRSPVPGGLVSIEGKRVRVNLMQPKLLFPAYLSVTLRGYTEKEISIESIRRQVELPGSD